MVRFMNYHYLHLFTDPYFKRKSPEQIEPSKEVPPIPTIKTVA
jgi:hypothetical protein